MEFENLVETLRLEDERAARAWESDDVHRLGVPRYTPAQLAEAATFIRNVEKGRVPMHRLKEALSTSDFPLMFADILDRQLLGYYQEVSPTWQAYARRSVVPDLRNVKRFAVDGAEKELEELDELEEYPKRELKESKDEFKVGKFGARLDMSWETGINDDLGAFLRTPERLARAARRTESKFATRLWIDEKGPHASLYKEAFKNIITIGGKQPPLSIESLQAAYTLLSEMVDEDGEPIHLDMLTLVVTPALEVVAETILNATEIRTVVNGGVTGQELQVANWMKSRLQLQVEPYIPFIASKENGTTTWALFAAPSTGRPALEMGFLRGNEDPALYERIPNARRVGGGGEANESFEDDSRAWKVRHVLGGTRLTTTGGFRATVASNGSGK